MACCQTIITAVLVCPKEHKEKSLKQWKLLYLYLFYLHAYFEHCYCVLSRNCTYQSHALLSKGGRPCNLQPGNNERIEGQISITVSSVSGSEMHILTRWENLPSHKHMENAFLPMGSTSKVKGCSTEKERKLGEGRTVGGSAGYPTCHLYSDLRNEHSYN